MDMLLKMQAWYDASQMRAREDEVRVRHYAAVVNADTQHG